MDPNYLGGLPVELGGMVVLGAVLVVPVVPVVPGAVLVVPVVPAVPVVPIVPLVPVVEVDGGGVVVVGEVPTVLLLVVPVVPEVGAGTMPAGHGLLTVALALVLPGEVELVELVELADVPLPAVEDVVGPTWLLLFPT